MIRTARVYQLIVGLCLCLCATRLGAQQPITIDSARRLNALGRWQDAATAARLGTAASATTETRCQFQEIWMWAWTRLGRLDDAANKLKAFDQQCAEYPVTGQRAADLASLRRDLALPTVPVSGMDMTGVERFWEVVDTLAIDREPSEALWHRLFVTPGYRFAMSNVQPIRADFEVGVRPSRRHERDSLARGDGDEAVRLNHLIRALEHRAALARSADSLMHGNAVAEAVILASRYLPPGTTAGRPPPLVAFAIFRNDGYSAGPRGVVLDLIRASSGGLTTLLGHEFHHSYLSDLNVVPRLSNDSPEAALVNAFINLRSEGIADQIDKPHPFSSPDGAMATYVVRYNEEYNNAPRTIAAIDSLLTRTARDSGSLRVTGPAVAERLWSAGHPVGAYMARTIVAAFGVDSLFPGIVSPFAFARTYAAAEVRQGHAPPFSDATLALLTLEETKSKRR